MSSTTAFGGKSYPKWQEANFELPGYKNATLVFTNVNTGEQINCGFLVSPSSSNEQRAVMSQLTKTMAGWINQRMGKNLTTISTSGYMLDTKNMIERIEFFNKYTKCAEDKKNQYQEYYNEWTQTLYMEGMQYEGMIQSFVANKSGNQPFMYQYSLNFLSYKEKPIVASYNANNSISQNALGILNESPGLINTTKTTEDVGARLTQNLYNILNR